VEVDINLLPEKKRNKILLQRKKEVQKAKDKAEKEGQKVKDKAEKIAKTVEKSGKSKASIPPLLLTKTSIAS
jgi:hypothetical protein